MHQGMAESGPGLNQVEECLEQLLLMTPKQRGLRIRRDHSAIVESVNHLRQSEGSSGLHGMDSVSMMAPRGQ